MWATKERVSCLHSTDDGPKSPKPVCYLIKELKPSGSCVNCVSKSYYAHSSELASFNQFITGYWVSYVICNQFNRWANIPKRKLPSSASSKWRVGSSASNRNPANNWCRRWVKVLVQSINQDHTGSTEGQEPSKVNLVEERSQAKMPRKANQCAKPKSTPGGQWQRSSLRITRITGWPMT